MFANLEDGVDRSTKCVAESFPSVQRAFVRYVFSILLFQLLLTTGIVFAVRQAVEAGGGGTLSPTVVGTVFWISAIGSLGTLFCLYVLSKDYPANMILLFVLTCCNGAMFSVGLLNVPADLLLRCLMLTSSVFVGLTIYTVQEMVEFTFLRSFLFSSLWLLIQVSILQAFFPAPEFLKFVFGCLAVLIFCGFIIFDTYVLHFKLTPEEYVFATVALYLDSLAIFLFILLSVRILGESLVSKNQKSQHVIPQQHSTKK